MLVKLNEYSRNKHRLRNYLFKNYRDKFTEYKTLTVYKVIFEPEGYRIISRHRGRTIYCFADTYEACIDQLVRECFFSREWIQRAAVGQSMEVDELLAYMDQRGQVRRIKGFHPFTVFKPVERPTPDCMTEVREVLSKHPASAKAKDFERSGRKHGDKLTNKLYRLAHEPDHHMDPRTAVRAYLLLSLSYPNFEGKQIRTKPKDPYKMHEVPLHTSSPGVIPSHHPPDSQSKRDNALDALGDMWQEYYEDRIPIIPSAVRYKEECIPVDKDGRHIYVCNTGYMLKELGLFQTLVHTPKNIFNGSATNLPSGSNAALIVLAALFRDGRDPLHPDNKLVCTDVSRSEYGQCPLMKMPLALMMLNISEPHDWWRVFKKQLICNFLCPFVAVKDDLVIQALNLFPSGFLLTLLGNSDAYKAAHWESLYELWRILHDLQEKMEQWKTDGLTDEELDAAAKEFLQTGDDHVRNKTLHAELIDAVKSYRFGIITEYQEGKLNEAIFLQKRVRVIDGMPRLVTDEGRTLAKAWHLAGDSADVREGLDSMKLECGDPELFRILGEAAATITRRHVTLKDSDRNPEVRNGRLADSTVANAALHMPTHKLYRVIQGERAASVYGMSSVLLAQVARQKNQK